MGHCVSSLVAPRRLPHKLSKNAMSYHDIVHESNLQAILKKCDAAEIRAIDFELQQNRVVLRGIVGSFYYKQIAQEIVKHGAKDMEIDNRIHVEYTPYECIFGMPSAMGSNDF